jgi:hypothetical protein
MARVRPALGGSVAASPLAALRAAAEQQLSPRLLAPTPTPGGRVPGSLAALQAFPGGVQGLIHTRSIHHDAPDALAFVHQLEPLVDVGQRHGVRDHRIGCGRARLEDKSATR